MASITHVDMLKDKASRLGYDITTVWLTASDREGNPITRAERNYKQDLQMSLRSNPAFQSTFPKIREFIQNAADYLEITDQLGQRMPSITLASSKPKDTMYKLAMHTDNEEILSFTAKDQNCLVIKQRHTFPLSPAVMKFGVVDASKKKGRSAGGFGHGMKDAIAQIIHEKGSVTYEMASTKHRVKWAFVSAEVKGKSPAIEESNNLRVSIKVNANLNAMEANTLTITIVQKDIARAFLDEVVPRCAVFWSANIPEKALMLRSDRALMLPTESHLAVCSIGDACKIDSVIVELVGKMFDKEDDLLPKSGIYCFGIFVQSFPRREQMRHTLIMCGSGSVKVTGRDRNAVHLPDVTLAVATLLVRSPTHGGPTGDLARATIAAQFGVRPDAALAARAAKLFGNDSVYLGNVVDYIHRDSLADIQFGRNVKCYLPLTTDTQRWAFGRIASMVDGAPAVHELPEDDSLYNVRLCKPLDPATITKMYIELAGNGVGTTDLPICTIARHVLRSGGIVGIDVAAINVGSDEVDPGFQTWAFDDKLYIAATDIDSICDRDRFRLLCTSVIASYTATDVRTGVAKLLEKSTELRDIVDEAGLSRLVDKLESVDVDNGIIEEEGEEAADAASNATDEPFDEPFDDGQQPTMDEPFDEPYDDSGAEVDEPTATLVLMLEAARSRTPDAVAAAIRIVRQRVA